MVRPRMYWRFEWASAPTVIDAAHAPGRRIRAITPYVAWLLTLLVIAAAAPSAHASPADNLYAQRALYMDARDHLNAGRKQSYRKAARRLQNYTLAPYLAYYELRQNVSRATDAQMNEFFERHGELPVAPLLRQRWLKHLGASAQWQRFLLHYNDEQATTLRCYHLRALYATGERERAFEQVAPVWTAGKSLPKACDPIFDLWIKGEHLTLNVLWQRLGLALEENQRTLARYLLTLFPESHEHLGQLYYRVHRTPERLLSAPLKHDNARQRDIVLHGIHRLLRKNEADMAERLWRQHAHWQFAAPARLDTDRRLLIAQAKQGEFPSDVAADVVDNDFAVAMATAAVRNQAWHQLERWIDRLDTESRNQHQWQYWLARALLETHGGTTASSERAELTLLALAEQRDYYGFLAAQHLNQRPALNARPEPRNEAIIAALQQRPEVARALELYAVREFIAARREWGHLLPQLSPSEQAAAAHLATDIGWPRQAIAAANVAGLHDELGLRFPLLHMMHYQRMSHSTEVPLTLLLAVSRQESAFDERARSSANARGLMQLLPSTAERVARGANLTKPTTTALYRPSTNIEIASHYLAMLLERFDGSRPLAIAGYNAGEHRVDRWIDGMQNMPMDVWIERIPFKETRNYVKNVLAFVQVYNAKLNVDATVLTEQEMRVPGDNTQLARQPDGSQSPDA